MYYIVPFTPISNHWSYLTFNEITWAYISTLFPRTLSTHSLHIPPHQNSYTYFAQNKTNWLFVTIIFLISQEAHHFVLTYRPPRIGVFSVPHTLQLYVYSYTVSFTPLCLSVRPSRSHPSMHCIMDEQPPNIHAPGCCRRSFYSIYLKYAWMYAFLVWEVSFIKVHQVTGTNEAATATQLKYAMSTPDKQTMKAITIVACRWSWRCHSPAHGRAVEDPWAKGWMKHPTL